MRFGEGSTAAQRAESLYVAYLTRESSVRGLNSHFARHLQKDLAAPLRRRQVSPAEGTPYCLITQTLISGCTSAWRRMGTR